MGASAYRQTSVAIESGSSLSDAARINYPVGPASQGVRETLVAIIMPSSWTTASITVQASNDDVNYANVYNVDGAELTIDAAASRWIAIDPADFAGMSSIKLRSGTAGTPVNQDAYRLISLVYRPVS